MAAQKVALITAGTAGLGAEIARVLARADFRLVSHQLPEQPKEAYQAHTWSVGH